MSDDRPIAFHGIRPDGSYAYPTVPDDELGRRLLRSDPGRLLAEKEEDNFRRLDDRLSPDDLAEAGWGVIFAAGTSGKIRDALRPLLERREEQAGKNFRRLERYPRERCDSFLMRRGAHMGDAHPDELPYYLLLVGGPQEIPLDFQWELDHIYAVGRLHFDEPEDYAAYVQHLLEAEDRTTDRPPSLELFGVKNRNDPATQRTSEDLVIPLAGQLERTRFGHTAVRSTTGSEATRDRLSHLLGGDKTPDVLFTASHGMVFDSGEDRQRAHQGAIVCSDWPGPDHGVAREHYFAGEDVTGDGRMPELAFLFACHSGGTPEWDSFPENEQTERALRGETMELPRLAPKPFLASLPRKLLAHPGGGSRAVIAHVDRAWTTSFDWNLGRGDPDKPKVPRVFQAALEQILDGKRIGFAMEPFASLYGGLARSFATHWEAQALPATRRDSTMGRPEQLARTFRAKNDARSFVVFGDPAARLHPPRRAAPVWR